MRQRAWIAVMVAVAGCGGDVHSGRTGEVAGGDATSTATGDVPGADSSAEVDGAPDETAIAEPTSDAETVSDVSPDVTPETTTEVVDEVDAEALEETAGDTSGDTSGDTASDTGDADDAGPDADPALCGNGTLDPGEACDDLNACADDGCASGCRLEPSAVLASLALTDAVAFDLDGDGKPDNLLGSSLAVAEGLNQRIAATIASGRILQLVTLGGDVGAGGDPCAATRELRLTLQAGADAACPPHAAPLPWLDANQPPAALLGDSDAFDACVPHSAIGPGDGPDNGLYAATFAPGQPAAPLVHVTAPSLALPLGPLGLFTIAGAHLEATCVAHAGTFAGLHDGRLGGVVPARALYAIDTSDLLPACPTALHAVLGLAGHIDQDGDQSGGKDFILWKTSPGGVPCITAPVVITACCDDGDCQNGLIAGEDCVDDPRIGDGFSAGFAFEANAVHIVGHASLAAGVCDSP